MLYNISRIIVDKGIDKVNIVKIDDIIYLLILKFNKNQYDSKTNSIIIENKNYYGIYLIIFIITVHKSACQCIILPYFCCFLTMHNHIHLC